MYSAAYRPSTTSGTRSQSEIKEALHSCQVVPARFDMIPLDWFIDDDLRSYSLIMRLGVLDRLITQRSTDPRLGNWVDLLLATLSEAIGRVSADSDEIADGDAWNNISDATFVIDDVWFSAPLSRRVQFINRHYDGTSAGDDIVSVLSYELNDASASERERAIALLAPALKSHPSVLPYLDPVEQVKQASQNGTAGLVDAWGLFSWQAQVLALYMSASLSDRVLLNVECQHSLTKLILQIYRSRWVRSGSDVGSAFDEGFTDYVSQRAWLIDQPIDVWPILPPCPHKVVRWCEGREWLARGESSPGIRAFCPRERTACATQYAGHYKRKRSVAGWQVGTEGLSYRLRGARLYANCGLPWNEWSVAELLASAGVTTHPPGLQRPVEYVTRLCGWVNRLEEIRQRMRCSTCNTPLRSNRYYAKNLARYNSTIAGCPEGVPHDHGIYFNHCWYCECIIDSRECKVQEPVTKYYLCLRCGSGPQASEFYTQGDLCPACGSTDVVIHGDHRASSPASCTACGHSFTLPRAGALTGPRASISPEFDWDAESPF